MKRIFTVAVVLAGLSSIAFAGASPAPEVGDVGLTLDTLIVIGGAVLLIRSRLRR